MTAQSKKDVCPHCRDTLVPGKLYCPNCGLAIIPLEQKVPVDAYITAKVVQELSLRLQDEALIVRELSNKTEDEIRARLKRWAWALGLFAILAAWFGISSFKDARKTIVDQAQARIEPIVKDVESRSKAAQGSLTDVEQRIPGVTKSLNDTADLAEKQRLRIEGQSADVGQKLQRFQAASDRADKTSSQFESKVTAAQRRLDQLTSRFETQSTQITRIAANEAIASQYPALMEEPFVQAGSVRFDKTKKKAGEKWVSVCVSPAAVQEEAITVANLQSLLTELTAKGYTPLLGNLNAGGRSGGPIWRATSGSLEESAVIYFRPNFATDAREIAVIAAKYVNLPKNTPQLLDGKPTRGFSQRGMDTLLHDGKLDAEVYISTHSH